MNTFDFMQATISHNLKDPHSKALEPDCLSHRLAITTQSQRGDGWDGGDEGFPLSTPTSILPHRGGGWDFFGWLLADTV